MINPIREYNLVGSSTGTTHKILDVNHITSDTFILSVSRNGFNFESGQHVLIEIENDPNFREYSIYSSPNDNVLNFLIRKVPNGYLSNKLSQLKKGDSINIIGPCGHYTLKAEHQTKPLVFIASGTGIAPFHSFVSTFNNLDYKIIHGIRYNSENYGFNDYDPKKYIKCVSGEETDGFKGRVTNYIASVNNFAKNSIFYICGNYNMIDEVSKILEDKGIDSKQIYKEYFFKF